MTLARIFIHIVCQFNSYLLFSSVLSSSYFFLPSGGFPALSPPVGFWHLYLTVAVGIGIEWLLALSAL